MAPLWPRRPKAGPVSGGSNLQQQSEGRGQANNDPESERRQREQIEQAIQKAIACFKQVIQVLSKMYKEYQEKQRERRRDY